MKTEYGWCVCCTSYTKFQADNQWLRDNYKCTKCGSIPRERALMHVIEELVPDFGLKDIHESSPAQRGASIRLRRECDGYLSSHFWADKSYCEPPHINIDLEAQTFPDEQFDVVILQDVFEHLCHPDKATREIHRTLRPGGFLIQTAPLTRKFLPSERRASLSDNGEINWLFEPEFHGNPINAKGSPVFWHLGYDLASSIDTWAGFNSIIISNCLPELGIEGTLCEVVVSRKC